MMKKILLGFGLLFVALLAVVATRPSEFRVTRTSVLPGMPTVLFDQVNIHRKVLAWNPFLKIDPNAKINFGGPEAGVGSVCHWDGNSDLGAGSCTIVESIPGQLVRCRMDWERPMQGTATVDFTFKPEGDRTAVTWAMYGKNNFIAKAASLFFDCEKICGPQFEKGLAALGEVAGSAHLTSK
ncbi:MAG: SRPBCC family protein [Verrucomicrobiales bacterium]|nr:SRPBCC family protein [Verrucomicrobiales bacterium]